MTQKSLVILIIEDETLIAMDLEDTLEDIGHSVVGIAASPRQALFLLDRHRPEIDAVLLDANLGGVSALPIARRLREIDVPFVITSGYEQHELLREGFDAPWVSKPYGSAEIGEALQTVTVR